MRPARAGREENPPARWKGGSIFPSCCIQLGRTVKGECRGFCREQKQFPIMGQRAGTGSFTRDCTAISGKFYYAHLHAADRREYE